MTRALRPLVALALAFGLLCSASAGADGPRLALGGQTKFPHRAFVLSLPQGASAAGSDVSVFENGDPVRELTVKSAGSASAGELGTVLVIDASNSMRGAPIRKAMAAARSFAGHRRPSQKLGVLTFNRVTHTLLEPTTDDAAIDDALGGRPRLAKETHLRDAAVSGIAMLRRARVRVGSVIVLSDGADTGSRASAARVARLARSAGVRIFTVGLESRFFKEATLTGLARGTGGAYRAAPSAAALGRIYDELGARLAREYVVRYSSVLGPRKRIRVDVAVEGLSQTATLTYTSPNVSAQPVAAAKRKASGFWASTPVLLIVGFGVAFLFCFGVASVVAQRHRPETAEERVAAFVAMSPGVEPDRPEEQDKLYDRVDRGLRGRAWWGRFSLDVEIGRIGAQPARLAVMTLAATVLVIWLFATIAGGWVVVFPLLIPLAVRRFVTYRASKQRVLFGEQLADNLQVIASAMRAGHSFGGALAVAVEDAPEPARTEFRRVVADERLGVPLETSLAVVVERMDNPDLHQVALIAALQREAGGNAAEVLDRVGDTIRERVSLRRLVSTLTAQGRLSRWVVSLVPVGLVMFIGLTKPGYLDPLFETGLGNALLVLAALMMVTGSLIMKKIADIEV